MTNGEKLQSVFPDTKIITQFDNPFGDRFMLFTLNNEDMQVNIDWWNAEYKEPTTKNDFAEKNECITCSLDEGDDCCRKLYEESMQEPTTKNDLGVDCISRVDVLNNLASIAKVKAKSDAQKSLMGRCLFMVESLPSVTPQPCEDAVSRQEVLYLIADYDLSMGQVVRGIHALPSVTPQELRWIPVSERLPEINEEAYSNYVLLSLRKTEWDIDKCQMVHITTIGYYDANAISSDGLYMDTEGWVLENGRILPLSDVTAWMPLPQVYREVEE